MWWLDLKSSMFEIKANTKYFLLSELEYGSSYFIQYKIILPKILSY